MGVNRMSLPAVSPGPPPTEVQKQASSAWVQLTPMTAKFAMRALKNRSRVSQLNTASSAAKALASQGRTPNSTVGRALGSASFSSTWPGAMV